MLLLIGNPGRLALQEARVLMIMEKRKPSMVGAPGTPLYTMTLEGQCSTLATPRL